MELPKIAIVGGGPSGLTLARLLQNAQIPCTLFELDTSRSARNPDLQGSLDLHTATGQQALKEAGLLARFQELSRTEGEAFAMVNSKTLHPIFSKPPPPPGKPNKPEIMRTELRDMLLDSLDPESIKWGKKLVQVKQARDDTFDLEFGDGSVEGGFDLVVGADGAWSRVRPLVSSETPRYAGISWVRFETPAKDVRQDINEMVGEGAVLVAGPNGKTMWIQRMTGGSVLSGLSMKVPENWVNDVGIDFSDGDIARKKIVEMYLDEENWSDTLREVVLGSKGSVAARPYWEFPIGFKWESRPGVAITGDAAHVMCPFAGVGANVSMEDSLELARSIIKRKADGKRAMVVDAVKEYDKSMFVRAEENATLTYKNMQKVFEGVKGPIAI